VPRRRAGRRVFEALRAWRQATARAEGVPAYVVAHDRTLREVALARPRSETELALVWGLGPAKRERFGEGLLAVVREASPD